MTRIIVDADACPKTVLSICQNTAAEYGIEVWTVASFNHQVESENHIMVGNAPQEADMRIVNFSTRGDIVVTQDWGLASLVLAKGAAAISPVGKIYNQEKMDFLLEEREIKAKQRRAGEKVKGPHRRTKKDDEHFARSLKNLLEKLT
ncbi:MAG: YaiI/YqxD family protein [Desulfotomaculum sp.]|nr:YaiI/YqxD family protein [Desulfotomaculum sp.]